MPMSELSRMQIIQKRKEKMKDKPDAKAEKTSIAKKQKKDSIFAPDEMEAIDEHT